MQISVLAGNKMKEKNNTLIFIDETQVYPHLLTLLKFWSQDNRFTYVASGSLLGVTLSETTSRPMGSIRKVQMFPLDFEEFLYANGVNKLVISVLRKNPNHWNRLMNRCTTKCSICLRNVCCLVVCLMQSIPISLKKIQAVREIQSEIHEYYAADAAKYGDDKKLRIRRIDDLIPANIEKKEAGRGAKHREQLG